MAMELASDQGDSAAPDDDEQHRQLEVFFELAHLHVERFEGTVQQLVGGGFLALFGAPTAQEDQARRAVLAALGLREALQKKNGQMGGNLRIGIATGFVVVGRVGDLIVGPVPDRAIGLKNAAASGEILISNTAAARVVHLVELEPVNTASGGLEFAHAGANFRVLGRSTTAWQSAFEETSLSPFLGREGEMGVLRQILAQAKASSGQIVGITGDAGAGKSRLLYELRRELAQTQGESSFTHLVAQCTSWGKGIPYLPLVYMIRWAMKIEEADSPDLVRQKVESGLDALKIDPEQVLPYFLHLLGVEALSKTLAFPGAMAVQRRTFDALETLIFAVAERNLVVLDVEDLHWVDRSSEEFFEILSEAIGAARIIVLATYRSGYRPTFLDKSYANQISMRPLSPQDSRHLIQAALGENRLALGTAETVMSRGEGNPFFLEELARSLADQDGEDKSLPDTVHGLLMARLDRLPQDHKRLIRTASVLGRDFSLALIRAVWEGPDPEPILSDLERWEFLYAVHSADAPGYAFKHALTQEATYESLLADNRRKLHEQAGRAIENLYSDRLEDVYHLLVLHYPSAQNPVKTVHYLTRFAEKTARDYAHQEAALALTEAIGQAENLDEEVRDRTILDLVVRLAESLLPLAQLSATLQQLELQEERLERVGDPRLTGQVRFWQAHTHSYLGDQEQAAAAAHLAIEAASQTGDIATEGKAWYVLGRSGFWAGGFRDGLRASLEAIVLLERAGEPWWQAQAYWVAGFHYFVLGDFAKSFDTMDRARAISQSLDDYRLDPSWSVGYFHSALGNWQEGIDACREGLELSRDPLNRAVAVGFLGFAQLGKGNHKEAISSLREAIDEIEGTGMTQLGGWFSVYLGEALLGADDPEAAIEAAHRGLDMCRGARFRFGEGLGLRVCGMIRRAQDHLESAERYLVKALDLFTELEVPAEAFRVRVELAQLRESQGRSAGVDREFEEAELLLEQVTAAGGVASTAGLAELLEEAKGRGGSSD